MFVAFCKHEGQATQGELIQLLVNCFGKKSSSKTSEFAVLSKSHNALRKSGYNVLEDISCHYMLKSSRHWSPVQKTST